jgi:hypothetical protein
LSQASAKLFVASRRAFSSSNTSPSGAPRKRLQSRASTCPEWRRKLDVQNWAFGTRQSKASG